MPLAPVHAVRQRGRAWRCTPSPSPTIARVDGVAAGAGLNLALGCDLVVASDRARFSEIFARRGLSLDFGGSWLLPRRVGLHKAKELALLAADDRRRRGRAHRAGQQGRAAGELDAAVAEWAPQLAAGPPIALAQTKALLNQLRRRHRWPQALAAEAAAQTVNFGTADTAEAIAAFLAEARAQVPGPLTAVPPAARLEAQPGSALSPVAGRCRRWPSTRRPRRAAVRLIARSSAGVHGLLRPPTAPLAEREELPVGFASIPSAIVVGVDGHRVTVEVHVGRRPPRPRHRRAARRRRAARPATASAPPSWRPAG